MTKPADRSVKRFFSRLGLIVSETFLHPLSSSTLTWQDGRYSVARQRVRWPLLGHVSEDPKSDDEQAG